MMGLFVYFLVHDYFRMNGFVYLLCFFYVYGFMIQFTVRHAAYSSTYVLCITRHNYISKLQPYMHMQIKCVLTMAMHSETDLRKRRQSYYNCQRTYALQIHRHKKRCTAATPSTPRTTTLNAYVLRLSTRRVTTTKLT